MKMSLSQKYIIKSNRLPKSWHSPANRMQSSSSSVIKLFEASDTFSEASGTLSEAEASGTFSEVSGPFCCFKCFTNSPARWHTLYNTNKTDNI